MQEPTKPCTKCAVVKPLSDFGKRAAKKDGRRSQCRACDSGYDKANSQRFAEARRQSDQANREHRLAGDRRRYWEDPERVRARKREAAKTESARETKREWRARNPDRTRAHMRAWRAKNPDADQLYRQANREISRERIRRYRARKRSVLNIPFTAAQLALRLSMFPGCWVCGDPGWTEVDHVKPLVVGGAHCLSNLRPICRSCNGSKSGAWPFNRVRASVLNTV